MPVPAPATELGTRRGASWLHQSITSTRGIAIRETKHKPAASAKCLPHCYSVSDIGGLFERSNGDGGRQQAVVFFPGPGIGRGRGSALRTEVGRGNARVF